MTLVERKLHKKLKEVCTEYGVPVPVLKLSPMKKANGTFEYSYVPSAFKKAKAPNEVIAATQNRTIKVSKHITEHFSYDVAEWTLMHEVAHYLDLVFNKTEYDLAKKYNEGHGTSFKKICVDLGGKMNTHHASGEFKEAGSRDFVANKVGFKYTCPCGVASKKTIRKISDKVLAKNYCSACHTYMTKFKVEKLG